MHHTILGAGACLLGLAGPALAQAGLPSTPCPGPRAPLHEAFVPANCPSCWAQPGPAARAWRLDWITPAGPDAELAVAALPEAAARQARRPAGQPAGPGPAGAASPQPASQPGLPGLPKGWRLAAGSGPAWQGYMGLSLQLTRRGQAQALPAGSTGWLALVEQVPAGSEGTAQPRTLVRAVAGPLPLERRQASHHLQAMRLPETSRPERLGVRAWVESPTGQVLALAADRCLGP